MTERLKDRLEKIERLESELLTKAHQVFPSGSLYVTDMFLFGATQRTVAQSSGFRQLIKARNFASATILLRTQIDTAMRVNGLSLIVNREHDLGLLMAGKLKFNQLKTGKPKDGRKPERLTDAFLRTQLASKYPWINKVYEETSEFVHLSFRHLWAAVAHTDENSRTFRVVINGTGPERDESAYYEICDAFFEASKLTSNIIVAMFMAVHYPEQIARETRSSTEHR